MTNVLFMTLTIGMIVAVISDLKSSKIPNLLTFPMMLFGLAWHGATSGISGIGFSTAGLFTGIGIFIVPFLMGGMGAGDVKLSGAAGAIIGSKGIAIGAMLAILLGGIYAVALLIIHFEYTRSLIRRLWATIKLFFTTRQFVYFPPGEDELQPCLKFGICIALGTVGYAFLEVSGRTVLL